MAMGPKMTQVSGARVVPPFGHKEHIDVVCLILLATSGAIVTEVIDYEAWLGSFWAPKEPSQVVDAVQ